MVEEALPRGVAMGEARSAEKELPADWRSYFVVEGVDTSQLGDWILFLAMPVLEHLVSEVQ
jgi:hypothetical protein